MHHKLLLCISFFLFTLQLGFAFDPVKDKFCKRTHSDIQDTIKWSKNHIGFGNSGGFLDMGVCWWHSRLQRSALSLALFYPLLAKPTQSEARQIIANLASMKVTAIPGYSDFLDFSLDHKDLIQDRLNQWQIEDGVARFAWINALAGNRKISALKLYIKMNQLFASVALRHRIEFVKLKRKGHFGVHAVLITNMIRTNVGFDLEILDSNSPDRLHKIKYIAGESILWSAMLGNFIPYRTFVGDLKQMDKSKSKYCIDGEPTF